MLFSATSKVNVKEGGVVHSIISEVARSKEGLWLANQECVELLQETDFLQTTILLESPLCLCRCFQKRENID